MGQLRILTMAMVWIALLNALSPPRLSRWRTVWPLLASSGLVPTRAANAASLRHRPEWEKETITCAAVIGPPPRRSVSQSGRQVLDDDVQLHHRYRAPRPVALSRCVRHSENQAATGRLIAGAP